MKLTSRHLALMLALTLGACSSTQTEEQSSDEVAELSADAPAEEANTDAVPESSPELQAEPAVSDSSESPIAQAQAAEPVQPASPTQVAEPGTYRAVEGDTLMKIAFENYGNIFLWKKIFEENRDVIGNPNVISPGTVLKLSAHESVAVSRNGEKYLIQSGDTLGKISNKVYGKSSEWRKIWDNNRELIRDPNKIYAGFYLYYLSNPNDQPEVSPQPVAQTPQESQEPVTPAAPVSEPAAAVVDAQPVQETATTEGSRVETDGEEEIVEAAPPPQENLDEADREPAEVIPDSP